MATLENKVIIVTGASRGIGEATARELARQGARVVLAARSLDALQTVSQSITDEGGQAHARSCDIADYAQVEALVSETLDHFGAPTGLVNNAGMIAPIAPLIDADPDEWARNVRVNIVGAFNACRAVLPYFAGDGVIVTLSSGAAHRALKGWSAYCAGKAGLAMLTNSLALETNARVYGFAPGVVDTEMQAKIRDSGLNEVSKLGREELSDPAEVARAVAWLFTGEAAERSGQEIDIREPEFRRRVGLEVQA